MKLNDVTYKVRSAKFEVYNELGPSLLESIYEADLAYELGKIVQNIKFKSLTDYTDFTDEDLF